MRYLIDSIEKFAEIKPEKEAVIEENLSLTYIELYEKILKLANWISLLPPKTRIGLFLQNSINAVISMYAIPTGGAIGVPLDITLHPRNIIYILKDCDIKYIITSTKLLPKLQEVLSSYPVKIILVDDNNWEISFHKIFKEEKGEKFSNKGTPYDTAFIIYTTGTTGLKKGVMLSQFNLLSAAKNIIEFMELGSDLVEVIPMPLTHSFGFARLRCVFEVGGTAILENGLLTPGKIFFDISKYKANGISMVPTGFSLFLGEFRHFFKQVAPFIKYIEIGSDFMKESLKRDLMNFCPNATICMHYGLTEGSRSTFINFHKEEKFLHTIGKPTPNVSIKIVDEDNKEVPLNTQGEIAVKGDMVMQGYWNKPEITKKVLVDKWLLTGDIGKMDENGYIYLYGRKNDVIKISGLSVSPVEIEEVLMTFPKIQDCAVVRINEDDSHTNIKIKAFIVPISKDIPFNFDELEKHCIKNLEPYKVPHEFELINSIPRTNSGKIQRNELLNKR